MSRGGVEGWGGLGVLPTALVVLSAGSMLSPLLLNSQGQNTGVGSLSLLQGIFPIQGLNPGLPLCRLILY